MTAVTCLRNNACEDQSFSSSISSPTVQRSPVMRLGTPVSISPTKTVSRSSYSGQSGAGTPPPGTTSNDSETACEVLPALSVALCATL